MSIENKQLGSEDFGQVTDVEENNQDSAERIFIPGWNEKMASKMLELRQRGQTEEADKIRNDLIEKNRGLAHYVVKGFHTSHDFEIGDLESFAYEGLIYAVDNYNPELEARLSTYAVPCIRGMINNGIRDYNRHKRVRTKEFSALTRAVKGEKEEKEYLDQAFEEQYWNVKKRLQSGSDIPSVEEVNQEIAREVEKKIQMHRQAIRPDISINSPKRTYDVESGVMREYTKDYPSETTADDPFKVVANANLADQIDKILDTISERERLVLILRFGLEGEDEKTLEEVGAVVGADRERVRQIESKALKKLRHSRYDRQWRDCIE